MAELTIDEIMQVLAPLVRSIVTTSVQEALAQVNAVKIVPGLVTQVDGETAYVRMDDGGLEAAPTPGVIAATRLGPGVTVGSRVLVAFFPNGGAAVAWSVTGT